MALYGSRQRYAVERPWSSLQEHLVSRALLVAEIPGGEIERIPGPKYNLFPPRFGYEGGQPGIDEVMSTSSMNPDFRYWMSGLDNFSGTARPSGPAGGLS